MKKFALIVAGGSGTRMKKEIPKQFMELNGLPVLMHTINKFENYDTEIEIILVLPEDHKTIWEKLCLKFNYNKKHKFAIGGNTRFESVKNGLDLIDGDGIVFIHDGVRPLVSFDTINNCFNTASKKGNALPVVPATESVRFSDGVINKSLNRLNYFLVQTPQTFKIPLIKNAYKQKFSDLFTDDASVLENMGEHINLVEGNRENIKITFPEDLLIASELIKTFF